MAKLTHFGESGAPRMVDVTGKLQTPRKAVAEGTLLILPEHAEALGRLPKGDALSVARIAGIQGAKRCSELIPLCHQIALTHVSVDLEVKQSAIRITAEATCEGKTGVEMEAYCAVAIAGLALIDMLKGVDPDLTLTEIRLLGKSGGKSEWKRSGTSK